MNSKEDTSNLIEMKDYWEFLFSGESWDLSHGGLISFTAQCFYKMKEKGMNTSALLDG